MATVNTAVEYCSASEVTTNCEIERCILLLSLLLLLLCNDLPVTEHVWNTNKITVTLVCNHHDHDIEVLNP